MGSYSSKQAHHDHNNVEGRVYAPIKETGESNGIDSRNSSCITQSHIDHGNKTEFNTSHNRITSPSGVSCHETNPNQSFKKNGDSRKTNPKGCEIESHPPPDVLDGQQSCIEPSLPVLKPDNQSSSDVPSTLDNDHEPQNNDIEQTDNRNESPRNAVSTATLDENGSPIGSANIHTENNRHETEDFVNDTNKKKQKPQKTKKKKRGTKERFSSKRKVGFAPNDANPSSDMTEQFCNDSEGNSFSRGPTSENLQVPTEVTVESMGNEDTHAVTIVSLVQNDTHPSAVTSVEVFNDSDGKSCSRPTSADLLNRKMKKDDSMEKEDTNTIRIVGAAPNETQRSTDTTEEVSNDSEGASSSRMDRSSSADIFLASSVRTKQNEADIIRQEQDMKIQSMTNEAERLENICKDQRSKQRNLTKDNSLCPPAFLQSMEHIEKCLDTLKKQIDELTLEKNGYLNRLSSVAGSMLTENNPNITDLNDPNRPTKLAEKWCKIYDDEWTDALESLEKKYFKKKQEKHEQFVNHLFSLIKVIYKTCQKKAKEQVGIFLLLTNPSSTQVNEMWSQIPMTERQHFTNSRKRMAEANIKMLQETVRQDDIYKKKIKDLNPTLDDEILDILQKSAYFETCLKICWQFVIQDPPLYLDFRPLKGEQLNKDNHKEYTKSGTVIRYVVWPALYLHKDKGALLAKGVVQPEPLTQN